MNILFVCVSNICRSPTAHGVFKRQLSDRNVDWVIVDSAGIAPYHIGKAPDVRAISTASKYGYDLSTQRARQVTQQDFYDFDLIFAMDRDNLANLQRIAPKGAPAKLSLFLSNLDPNFMDVPDPYYGDNAGFVDVLKLCEKASDAFIESLKAGELS